MSPVILIDLEMGVKRLERSSVDMFGASIAISIGAALHTRREEA